MFEWWSSRPRKFEIFELWGEIPNLHFGFWNPNGVC